MCVCVLPRPLSLPLPLSYFPLPLCVASDSLLLPLNFCCSWPDSAMPLPTPTPTPSPAPCRCLPACLPALTPLRTPQQAGCPPSFPLRCPLCSAVLCRCPTSSSIIEQNATAHRNKRNHLRFSEHTKSFNLLIPPAPPSPPLALPADAFRMLILTSRRRRHHVDFSICLGNFLALAFFFEPFQHFQRILRALFVPLYLCKLHVCVCLFACVSA